MTLITIVLLVIVSGINLSRYFNPKANLPVHISIGTLLGTGIYIMTIYILGIMGVSWISLVLVATAIFIYIISAYLLKQSQNKYVTPSHVTGILLVIFLTSFSLIVNTYWPIRDWDALTLYDFRAKVFTENHRIDGIFTPEINYYLAYPFFTSIVHTISYTLDFHRPGLYYSLIYLSLGLYIYGFLSSKVSKLLAILTTVLVLTNEAIFSHSFISYTNLTYTTYFVVGLLTFSEGIAIKNSRLILLGSLLFGIMQHVRFDDPFWVIPIIISAFIYMRKKAIHPLLTTTLVILAFRLTWSTYKSALLSSYNIAPAELSLSLIDVFMNTNPLHRLIEVTMFLYKTLWLKYGLLVYIFVFSVLLSWRNKSKLLRITQLSTFLIFAILYLGTFVMSYIYNKWNIVGGSVSRMMMIMVPTILVSTCLSLGEFFNEKK